MTGTNRNRSNVNSTETILTFDNRDQMSDWSVVWSTSHVPGMDTATGGGGTRRRAAGRKRLRIGALALCSLLTMHVRVSAAAVTGGYFLYILLLGPAMAILANPMRHFEVYLGQWSISGPGRAFRIVPMFEGIGLAIAIGSLVRAMVNCAIAALAAVYLIHAVSDSTLPYTTCRDFDLKSYAPELKEEPKFHFRGAMSRYNYYAPYLQRAADSSLETLKTNVSEISKIKPRIPRAATKKNTLSMCKNPYQGQSYPPYCETAPYNFFYVEVARYRPNEMFKGFHTKMAILIVINWAVIWACMISERLTHGRLIWNNFPPWFLWIAVAWTAALCAFSVHGFVDKQDIKFAPKLEYGSDKIITAVADALETAIYVHAASAGTEIIHGKGLNHYASGHIDSDLNRENVWHSCILMILTAFSNGGSAICAIADFSQTAQFLNKTQGSTTWVLPMYSRCATFGTYTHLKSSVIFSGLILSYVSVSYVLVKTALHTIFEYRVKLVFIEQYIVGALVLVCACASMVFATKGGLPLLESVDSLMAGLGMPFVCVLELLGILYVYHGRDFVSDMNISMEENACSSRMETQWQSLPFIVVALLGIRLFTLIDTALPSAVLWFAAVPLVAVIIAAPIRAAHNAYVFLRPAPRRGV